LIIFLKPLLSTELNTLLKLSSSLKSNLRTFSEDISLSDPGIEIFNSFLPPLLFIWGKIIRTRNRTIVEFQQKVSDPNSNEILSEHNLNETDEVILVKNDGILPVADGFPLNHNFHRRHTFGRPRIGSPKPIQALPPENIQRLGNLPEAPKIRSFKEVETGLNVLDVVIMVINVLLQNLTWKKSIQCSWKTWLKKI
jgi:hypothetical protein